MARQGPGKAHRAGITLAQLFEMFPDEESARLWFEEQLWPHGPECPKCCGREAVTATANQKPLPYWCGACRRHFSVRMGTAMERSRVSLRKWAIAIYLEMTSLKGVSSMKLHRDLGVTQKTAWFMLHRIREAWAHEASRKFSGPVEADESFFGGSLRNMHRAKKAHYTSTVENKTAVTAVLDRKSRQVRARVLPDGRKQTVERFVMGNLQDGATLYTDEGAAFQDLYELDHHSVNHAIHEYVRGPVHTNTLESFWSMLKRAYVGTYHHLSEKHLQRYVNEFAGRYGMRELGTHQHMRMTAYGLAARRLTYDDLTA